jgi:transglutaminase-like putative cysteine protease
MAPLNARWEETTERMNRLYQGLNRQTRPTAATFGRNLRLGGARNVGSGAVFRVSAASGRYWRAVVYDTYTGQQWLNTGEEEETYRANEEVPVGNWGLRQPLTQTITMLAPAGSLIFAAPDIWRVDLPMAAYIRPLPAETAEGEPAYEVAMARSRRPLEKDDTYRVVSAQTAVTQRSLEGAGEKYPDSIREQYLQLPDDFSERVAADAAAITADHTTPYAKARAIETYLRSYTYNDNIDAPAPGQDPVEYFLYDIREGYCDYYATSMVVMLRSLGIPARLVSGYAEGAYDPEMALYTITEQDAHTWVEVFFPGYGWVEFEPTAGETQLNRPSGDEPAYEDTLQGAVDPNTGAPIPQNPYEEELLNQGFEDALNQPFFEDGSGLTQRNWWLWAVLTPVVLVVGGWLIWRTRISGPTRFDPDLPPILFERLQRWAARLGLGPAVHETPYEQARQLTRALPDGLAPIESITESYVRYRFGRRSTGLWGAPSRGVASAVDGGDGLITSWQSLEPVLWRAWVNKLAGLGFRSKKNPFALVKK